MIRLLISLYDEPNKERLAEIESVVKRNIQSKLFDEIYTWNEGTYFSHHPFKEEFLTDSRPTFDQFFTLANELMISQNDVTVIANNDIYFDDSITGAASVLNPDQCFALSRWDVLEQKYTNSVGNMDIVQHYDQPDSQDVWMFKGDIHPVKADFGMGIPGCDNRLAHQLHEAGYEVINPSKTVKCYHMHLTGIRHYDRKREVVDPPYRPIPITAIGEKPLRIFHVSLDNGKPQNGLNRALQSLGDYKRLEWPTLPGNSKSELILKMARAFEPDLTFMQLQQPGIVKPDAARQLPGVVINWTGDVRTPLPPWYIDVGKEISMSLFTNLNDVDTMQRSGARADYLQIGYDPLQYTPFGEKVNCPPVVFLGNDYGNRFPLSKMRRDLVKQLLARYPKHIVGIYGNYKGAINSFMSDPNMEAAILRSAKIVINLSHFNYRRYSSDRLQRALGCKAFVLSHHYPEIEKDYVPNRHLVTWRSIGELDRLIRTYLTKDSVREQIATNGYKHVRDNHSWDARMKPLKQYYHEALQPV